MRSALPRVANRSSPRDIHGAIVALAPTTPVSVTVSAVLLLPPERFQPRRSLGRDRLSSLDETVVDKGEDFAEQGGIHAVGIEDRFECEALS